MPFLPENIWRRRLSSEHAEMAASALQFRVNPDFTEYIVTLVGPGFSRETGKILPKNSHEVRIVLKREYPYAGGFDLTWITPIFHPNIREEDGKVCIQLVNQWMETQTVRQVVEALERLLREANPASPLNLEAAEYFVRNGIVPAPVQKPGRPRLVF